MLPAHEAYAIVNATPERIDAAELYAALIAIGAEIDSHESDLYVKINDPVAQLVSRYQFKINARMFTGPDGTGWYDIPFAYMPFWKAKGGNRGD